MAGAVAVTRSTLNIVATIEHNTLGLKTHSDNFYREAKAWLLVTGTCMVSN